MSELRKDPIIGQWVIVKVEDTWAPEDYQKEDNTPREMAISPFIYGRESMTPPEVSVIRPEYTSPNSPGWQTRVVSNKFPALKIEGNLDRKMVGVYETTNGVGAHEVVIEVPDPAKQFADYSIDEIIKVLEMYQERYIDLSRDKRFKYIMIFKNFGESSGASIEHAHSQVIALPMTPKYVQEKLDGAQYYYSLNQRSIFMDMLEQEKKDQNRIVSENEDFMCFCPFAPRFPFESWIFPKNVQSKFHLLNASQLEPLAKILKDTLSRLKNCLSNPSYNFYLQLDPVNTEFEQSFVWHIEILPQLSRVSEFDWDTGFYVVHTPPDLAAKYLRDTKI